MGGGGGSSGNGGVRIWGLESNKIIICYRTWDGPRPVDNCRVYDSGDGDSVGNVAGECDPAGHRAADDGSHRGGEGPLVCEEVRATAGKARASDRCTGVAGRWWGRVRLKIISAKTMGEMDQGCDAGGHASKDRRGFRVNGVSRLVYVRKPSQV